jgi:hemolysin III
MQIARTAYSFREELANALIHGLGVVASLCGGSVLITLAAMTGDGWRLAGAIVFSVSMLLLYAASTLYHAIPHAAAKARLKVFDHCAIFVLIAGTYTPITLISLRATVGWWLFAAIWALAAIGIVFKLFFTGRFKGVSTLVYVAMGWLALLVIGPLVRALSTAALAWLLIGGAAYTLGALVYMSRRAYAHAAWHGFVLLGSVSHFVSIAIQVLQKPMG